MIDFKNRVNDILPYDRRNYKTKKKWFGVSFQLPGVFEGKDISLDTYIENYEDWFKNVISKLDNNNSWIINHDFVDEDWFPNKQNNLKHLRMLFKQNNIPNEFKGAIVIKLNDLLKLSKDLISYPYAVLNNKDYLYNNLDISHSELPFVIKISGHLNIDLLSTDEELLRKIINENISNRFVIKVYRGTTFL